MIQEFATYLRSIKGYSENTIRAYCADLRTYAQWARENTPQARWRETTREHIDKFLEHQHQQGMKPATTNRQLAAIASLFRYFQRQGYEVDNPCQYESRRKIAQTIPTTIPAKQIAQAYRHANGLKKTIIGLLATTGIRIQELLDLQWQDINFEDYTIHVNGKGSKERIVKTEAFVMEDLERTYQNLHPKGKMFYISQRQARYMVYEALQPYCHARQLCPHAIRHTFATELAKQGESTSTLAKILGHAHIETSQKYIDMSQIGTSRTGICLT